MLDEIRKLKDKLLSLVSRGVVDRRATDGTYQVLWGADRASADVEHLEPQGVHFAAPAEASGALLSLGGNKSASALVCASGAVPSGSIAAGEGGLHYLGEWKVFLAADGTLALSAKAPSDWISLASKCDSENAARQSEIEKIMRLLDGGSLPPWVPVPMDGGAALQLAAATAFSTLPATTESVASAKVKAE